MDKTTPFSVLINEQQELQITPDAIAALDKIQIGEDKFHVLDNKGKSHKAEVIATDFVHKTFTVKVNGNPYTVKIMDKYDRLVKQMGLGVASAQKSNIVKAPMPGLVLQILVEVGQEVQKGESLLILEAMKMENVLKAVGDGRIKSIKVQKGNPVDKGQLLIEME